MTSLPRHLAAASLLLACMAGTTLAQSPVGSDFTYQGKLHLSGTAVNGAADFQFRLFNAATAGTQVGSTVSFTNVGVADGLFTSRLDFGAGAFNGDARYLEIAVRSPAGAGSFVTLTPRQPMTAAPYALRVPGVDGHSLNGADGSHTDALFVNNAGRVGIGTTSPTSLLDLSGAQDALRIRGSQPYMTLVDTNATGSPRAQLQNSDGRFFVTSEAFLSGSNTGAFTMFDAQGRLGVGTFSPISRVEIAAQDALAISGYQPFITLRDTNAGGARALISSANGDLGFYTDHSIGSTPPVIIENITGSVGIGEANPSAMLDVRSTASRNAINAFTGAGTALNALNSGPSGTTIGISGSCVSPEGFAIRALSTATTGLSYGVWSLCSSSTGYDFFAAGAGINYGSTSSRRWKHNVEPIADPLEKLSRLRGVYFDWDADHGGQHDVGMIAEEVGLVLPEVVSYEANGVDASGMDYSKLSPLLVEALKAQQIQIQELQDELAGRRQADAQLREQLATLTRRMDAMIAPPK